MIEVVLNDRLGKKVSVRVGVCVPRSVARWLGCSKNIRVVLPLVHHLICISMQALRSKTVPRGQAGVGRERVALRVAAAGVRG